MAEGSGWRFDFPVVRSPLCLTYKTCQVVNCLVCFRDGLSAICLKKTTNGKKVVLSTYCLLTVVIHEL